ncbi:hypothetical protein G9464_10445 [Halostella sp. JP-L12]|nr:hypothetical protein [Halostella sp. JP-L12]
MGGVPMGDVAPQPIDPPNETDHGVNETTFHALWSGDVDIADSENLTDGNRSEMAELAMLTDIPFNAPPRDIERWNSGDHREFPETSPDVSIHPRNTTLEDGRFVKDAYVDVFAIQPSTRAQVSAENQPLYVAPNGSLLATLDYRVRRPVDTETDTRRSTWSIDSHEIAETRLLVDGDVETTRRGTHTPRLGYTSLDSYVGTNHTLAVEADIAVTLEHNVTVCVNESDDGCEEWNTTITHPTETLTVNTSRPVSLYTLRVSGFAGQYPNGDQGIVAYNNQPWAGYSLPGGGVQGVWRFYSARDRDWDVLVHRTSADQWETRSPLQPLQVYAYPSEIGPTTDRGRVEILATHGRELEPGSMPENVELDAVTAPYTASFGLATRTELDDPSARNVIDKHVTADGIVRGVSTNVTATHFVDVPINESTLTVAVTNVTDETVTATVRLRDAATGEPIATADREGVVVLNGERVQTNASGIAVLTLPRSGDGVTARYEPAQWWRHEQGYVGDSDTAYVRGTVLQTISTVYRILVPVATVLVVVYVLDRLTSWGIWPPWRGM